MNISEIITLAQNALTALRKPVPLAQGIHPAITALHGLPLSSIPGGYEEIDFELVAMNQIEARNDIAVTEDYAKLADPAAEEMCARIQKIAELCIDKETNRVLQQLENVRCKLPVDAILEIRQHRDLFIPLLIDILEQVSRGSRAPSRTATDSPFFALYLLTEFRAQEAWPTILKLLHLPGDDFVDHFGDATQYLTAPLLAAFYTPDGPDEIQKLVFNQDAGLEVGLAAPDAYSYLVRDGVISREAAIEKLTYQFQRLRDLEEPEILGSVAITLGDFAATSALDMIRSAYEQDQIDTGMVGLDHIEEQIRGGEETVKEHLSSLGPTGVADTIEQLRSWACFDEPAPLQRPAPCPTYAPRSTYVPSPHFDEQSYQPSPAEVTNSFRVGRNDPCPCGSGKKFKKCCL